MLIAQITDCHVTAHGASAPGALDNNGALAAAVAHLNALRPRPDVVLLTGDLTNDGTPEQYQALRGLLAPLEPPFRVLPGNHDDRQALRAAFPEHGYLGAAGDPFLHYVDNGFRLRIIALDTVVPGRPEGELCPRRLGWLAKRLSEAPDRPSVIAMHHPPIETGISHMDAMRCFGVAVLGALVSHHPQVQAILCGHLHRPASAGWHGTMVHICPSTTSQVGLTLGPGDRGCFTDEPPAAALHLWRPGVGLVSHLSFIGGFRARPLPL